MIALRRGATEVIHEDYMDGNHVVNVRTLSLLTLFLIGVLEVQAKKKKNLIYYA